MEQVIWGEKYRPKNIQECILPTNLKKIFSGIVNSKQVPNMLLCGGAGMGKTTVAKAICNELNIDWMMINSSEQNGIDVLRTDIKNFVTTMAFDGNRKILILDEADYLTAEMQAGLRGVMTDFADNCGFILTCNFKNKLINPIHSRCSVIDFKFPKEERKDIYKNLFERVCSILQAENVNCDKKVVAELIARYFPDIRRLLNELQAYSKSNGEINSGILGSDLDIDIANLFKALKEQKYNDVREWVVNNLDNDSVRIYRKVYDNLKNFVTPNSIPMAVLLLSEYQHRSAFSADQEICLLAFLVRLMVECEWT